MKKKLYKDLERKGKKASKISIDKLTKKDVEDYWGFAIVQMNIKVKSGTKLCKFLEDKYLKLESLPNFIEDFGYSETVIITSCTTVHENNKEWAWFTLRTVESEV